MLGCSESCACSAGRSDMERSSRRRGCGIVSAAGAAASGPPEALPSRPRESTLPSALAALLGRAEGESPAPVKGLSGIAGDAILLSAELRCSLHGPRSFSSLHLGACLGSSSINY